MKTFKVLFKAKADVPTRSSFSKWRKRSPHKYGTGTLI